MFPPCLGLGVFTTMLGYTHTTFEYGRYILWEKGVGLVYHIYLSLWRESRILLGYSAYILKH